MRRTVALLAAVLALAGLAGCGEGGAEPGAPEGATLVLDFTPNAIHTGIYAGLALGYYRDEGIDLQVQAPGESSDAPKLLAAGKVEFAILDVQDLAIARDRGIDVVGVAPILVRPLAAVIARADGPVRRPRDLEGRRVGVTGLPSDEAVVDSEVEDDGGDPDAVERVMVGFNAVPALAAGKVDAVTGFWGSEAVALERQGVPVRVFKVDEHGAPSYPELVLVTSRRMLEEDPELVDALHRATRRGYSFTNDFPKVALDELLAANPELDRAEQTAQLDAMRSPLHPGALEPPRLRAWAKWALRHGIVEKPIDVEEAFDLD
jgi:putative hydroxymethylpyrimidine transport system substrate-binding protein